MLVFALLLFLSWAAWNYLPNPIGVVVGGVLAILALLYLLSGIGLDDPKVEGVIRF